MTLDVLQRQTLVLNRNWQPIHVTSVVRALTMLWNEAARVVDPDDFRLHGWEEWSRLVPGPHELFIRTSRNPLRVPEVVCLKHYDRFPSRSVAFSRRNIAKRDHHTCQYCGIQPGWDRITIDHVLPRSRGGASSWSNCVAACADCNASKGDRLPEQAGMKLRKRPTRPDWKPFDAIHGAGVTSWLRFVNEEPALALA